MNDQNEHIIMKRKSWPYDPAPMATELAIEPKQGSYINGRAVVGTSKSHGEAINPATGETLCRLTPTSVKDMEKAAAGAKAAKREWGKLGPANRTRVMQRIARVITDHAQELALLESLDTGMPAVRIADEHIDSAQRWFAYYAGWCDKLAWVRPGAPAPKPVGLCGLMPSWRAPLMSAAQLLAPALAAGNGCVVMPVWETSLFALRLAALITEAGAPDGLVNVVTGDDDARDALINRVRFDALGWIGPEHHVIGTGNIGSVLAHVERAIAYVVFESAPLDQAIEAIVRDMMDSRLGARVFCAESILETVIEKLTARLSSVRVGDPLDRNTEVGAMCGEEQVEIIDRFRSYAVDEGSTPQHCGGQTLPEAGWFRAPAVVSQVYDAQQIAQCDPPELTVSVMSFRTPTEAIAKVNALTHGAPVSVWAHKGSLSAAVASAITAPVAWCGSCRRFDPAAPMVGSGFTNSGCLGGAAGLHSFLA